MDRWRPALVLAALAASPLASLAPIAAQDPPRHALALAWKPEAGSRVRVVESTVSERTLETVDAAAKPKKDSTRREVSLDYVRAVASLAPSGAVREERRTFTVFSCKEDDREDRTLEGKTVVLDRSEARAKARVEPATELGPLARELVEQWKLDRAPDVDALVSPEAAVQEGGEWELLLAKALAALADPAFDHSGPFTAGTSHAKAKLVRATAKDGRLDGKVEVTVETTRAPIGTFGRSGGDRIAASFEGRLDGKGPERVLALEATFEAKDTPCEPGPGQLVARGKLTRKLERTRAEAK